VAVRASYQLEWFNKPWVGGKIIKGQVESGVEETVDFYSEWAPAKIIEARQNKVIQE
jgi:hypothetical protein